MRTKKDLDRFWDLEQNLPVTTRFCRNQSLISIDNDSSDLIYGPLMVESVIQFLYSNNSSDGITGAQIEAGTIRDLDATAFIESEKSDITCNDTQIVSCLHFAARHNNFIDNNVNLPYFTTCV